MICQSPVLANINQYYPCGQCMPCRINRKRLWMHRMLLEMNDHPESSFVTLTYDDERLPPDGNLEPRHLQLFLKSLRKNISPMRVRYFSVGEYGEQTKRPHYHLALFGYPICLRGGSLFNSRKSCCPWCDRLRDAWNRGGVFAGPLSSDSAQYICGYVTKKLTRSGDPRLEGRVPEFARMSLRPGIGSNAAPVIAETMQRHNLDSSQGDVPSALRHGKKMLPLGRYLRGKTREALGWEKGSTDATRYAYSLEMLALQQAAIETGKSPVEILKEKGQTKGLTKIWLDKLNKKGKL